MSKILMYFYYQPSCNLFELTYLGGIVDLSRVFHRETQHVVKNLYLVFIFNKKIIANILSNEATTSVVNVIKPFFGGNLENLDFPLS